VAKGYSYNRFGNNIIAVLRRNSEKSMRNSAIYGCFAV
jgi:hypothetical protein